MHILQPPILSLEIQNVSRIIEIIPLSLKNILRGGYCYEVFQNLKQYMNLSNFLTNITSQPTSIYLISILRVILQLFTSEDDKSMLNYDNMNKKILRYLRDKSQTTQNSSRRLINL